MFFRSPSFGPQAIPARNENWTYYLNYFCGRGGASAKRRKPNRSIPDGGFLPNAAATRNYFTFSMMRISTGSRLGTSSQAFQAILETMGVSH